MRKSSSSTKGGVKVTAKEMEQLLNVLKPNIRAVVKEGVEQYIGNGTRFMLELLMHAEAQELCGKWNSRPGKRELGRWGTEKKATALINGASRQVHRPRVRILRSPKGESAEVQLQTYPTSSLCGGGWRRPGERVFKAPATYKVRKLAEQ